jgi:formyltetrahydrofolate deformylase
MDNRYILTLSCKDVRGIVAAVSRFLADRCGFIVESGQFGDASTGRFFVRVDFGLEAGAPAEEKLRAEFADVVAKPFSMQWEMRSKQQKSRVLIMVSKEGHCLNDLLYRHETGQLAIDIPAIVSNHPDLEHVAKWHNVPFYHLPIGTDKSAQEKKILEIVKSHSVDVVVLARYMQILSPEMCAALAGKAINIHHSFLPSFKGARPYAQAYARGVKIIGATAHYVTTDLDEGPIIEQEVARVDHAHCVDDLVAIGRDIECLVLSRALKYHAEHRVLLNAQKTVVFR